MWLTRKSRVSESSFHDDEIRQEFRRSISRKKNIDYDKVKLERDLIAFAKIATRAKFRAKLPEYGIDPGSQKERNAMRLHRILTQGGQQTR